MNLFWGLLIPFLGTTLGSMTVFLMKNKMNNKLEKVLLGFASGVMIAASVCMVTFNSCNKYDKGTGRHFMASCFNWIFTWNSFLVGAR